MYKVVCVTPAGRNRYMKYLIPQIISSPLIDRYDIWLNTVNKEDIDFLYKMERQFSKINIIVQPDGEVNGNKTINAFFRQSTDVDTIYIRLDDDIIWIEPNFFEKIIDFRLKNKNYFLVTPLVINNALSSYLLQKNNKLIFDQNLTTCCFDKNSWVDPYFAKELHTQFIKKVMSNSYSELYTSNCEVSLNRFSINSICWFGSDFKLFEGNILDDEEEFVSCIKPMQLGKVNCILGHALVSHFAFFTQRELLDNSDILSKYEAVIDFTYKDSKSYNEVKKFVFNQLVNKKSNFKINLKKIFGNHKSINLKLV